MKKKILIFNYENQKNRYKYYLYMYSLLINKYYDNL